MRTQGVLRGSVDAPSGHAPSRRRCAVDLAAGVVVLLAVTATAVLPATPGASGRAAWAEVAQPFLWLLLVLWACASALRRGPAVRQALAVAGLAGGGLAWQGVLLLVAGRAWSEEVHTAAVTEVATAVALGTVAGILLRRLDPGRSLAAYVLGRVVTYRAAGPLLAAGRDSLPLYLGSQVLMLALLTVGQPAWGYRLGEWAEPYALGHNRAGVVLLVVTTFWVVVWLAHLRRPHLPR